MNLTKQPYVNIGTKANANFDFQIVVTTYSAVNTEYYQTIYLFVNSFNNLIIFKIVLDASQCNKLLLNSL